MTGNGFDIWHELASNLTELPRIPTRAEIEAIFGESRIVPIPRSALCEIFESRSVLVTGAAGSIGSELSRQLSTLNVSHLLLLDHAENSLFEFEREMREYGPQTEIVPILGDVRDRGLLDNVFDQYAPNAVFHSAAYKHLPMMEAHPCEAFLNNVVGTRNVLDCALGAGCEHFILISSDKAANPVSTLGATKRLGEMLVRSRAKQFPDTHLASVRFGNVIGSRGSVIPIFLKQIATGRPVTLTDRRMSRYFISMAEAVQFVLQAATLGSKGDTYILEMAEPMKIATLAEKLIAICGLEPEGTPVVTVGVRPGEKLQEELWSEDASVTKTDLPGILRIDEGEIVVEFEDALREMEQLARAHLDDELRQKLHASANKPWVQQKFATLAGSD